MMTKVNTQNYLAIVCLLFSASMWGIIWYPLRLLDEAGMSAVWASFVMYVAASIVALPFMIKARFFSHISVDLVVLAIAAGVTSLAFLVALIEGEIMRVMLLLYLSPIWSVLLSRWWLGEKLSPLAIMMFGLAMAGSLVMLWNPDVGFPWPTGLGDWLALIASVAFSVNNVMGRKLGPTSMTLKSSALWLGVMSVSAIVLVAQQAPLPEVTVLVWTSAALIGILGIIPMTIATLYGLAKMPIYRSSVIMLFELVVGAISAWLLSNELLSLHEWLGGGLILLAAYGVARSDSE
jgi:drug/metabolite transporter (DMT)-like permease